MAFYRRDENNQLCCNVLFDMIEECGEGFDEKPAGNARHINDTSANYYEHEMLQGAAGAGRGRLQAST
jgi:hypothetical protein